MTKKAILFDLDGTLTDSGEGIINCFLPALQHFGLPVPDRAALREIVGPPLNASFLRFGLPENCLDEAVKIFRDRYNAVGKFENQPYEGIEDLLKDLKAQGYPLYVATSKPEIMAVEILEHYSLSQYFVQICGASLDESRASKDQVIAYLLERSGKGQQMVMVGDTKYDVLGAKAHGIPAIGVSWGYGTVEEMTQAGAVAIADSPRKLLELLTAERI